jgi:hypothetical protein
MQITMHKKILRDQRGHRDGSNWEVAFFRR